MEGVFMKKSVVLAILTLMLPSLALANGGNNLSIYLNGEDVTRLEKPANAIIRQDRTYLPIRTVAEELNYKVDWIQEKKEVKISNNETTVSMKLGSKNYEVNKEKKKMDVEPFLDKDTTYIPVRFLEDSLGLKIHWDEKERLILLGEHKISDKFKGQEPRYFQKEDMSFILPEEYKKDIVFEDGKFYDRKNYEADRKGLNGFIVEIFRTKSPRQELNNDHLIFGYKDGFYYCLSHRGDATHNEKDKELSESFLQSYKKMEDIIGTIKMGK